MYIKKKKLKKLIKEDKLRDYVEHKVLKEYSNFIEDFNKLAFENDWVWFWGEINLNTIYKKLVDRIEDLITHNYSSTSCGRILIIKNDYGDAIEIKVAIEYG